MSNFFDILEKYKFGLLAALLAYIVIFAYFQLGTYNSGGVPYSPFHQGARVEIPEDEIQLLPENIMLPANFDPSNLKNAARDANDKRTRSEKDYSTTEETSNGEQDAIDFEKQLFIEAGGAAKQERIKAQNKARKEREKQQAKTNAGTDKRANSGSTNAAAGTVSLEYSLISRKPVKLPKPTYMCGVGSSGRVTIIIKVDQNGTVISATHDPSKSSPNASYCMISQAEKFAKKSRFNSSGSAPNPQVGWIAYIFVSQ